MRVYKLEEITFNKFYNEGGILNGYSDDRDVNFEQKWALRLIVNKTGEKFFVGFDLPYPAWWNGKQLNYIRTFADEESLDEFVHQIESRVKTDGSTKNVSLITRDEFMKNAIE